MNVVNNKTVTDARFKEALKRQVTPIINETVPQQIEEAVDNVTMKAGRVTKFYPYLDKAEVQLYDSNKKVYCKLLHKFFGELMDFYTPLAEEEAYCDVLHEPCVVPRLAVNCFVVNVQDGTNDWLLVGYYPNSDEIVGLAPAKPGNVKFSYINGLNEFWLEFGRDGLDVRLPSEVKSEVGRLKGDMRSVRYAKSDEVYGKDEVYTKGEVYPRTDVYTKSEVYPRSEVYTKEEVDELIDEGGGGGDMSKYVKKSDVSFTVTLLDNGCMSFELTY